MPLVRIRKLAALTTSVGLTIVALFVVGTLSGERLMAQPGGAAAAKKMEKPTPITAQPIHYVANGAVIIDVELKNGKQFNDVRDATAILIPFGENPVFWTFLSAGRVPNPMGGSPLPKKFVRLTFLALDEQEAITAEPEPEPETVPEPEPQTVKPVSRDPNPARLLRSGHDVTHSVHHVALPFPQTGDDDVIITIDYTDGKKALLPKINARTP